MAEHLNDIDLTSIKGFSDAVRANPAMGKLTMKAHSTWQRGTKALVTTGECTVLGGQQLFAPTRQFALMVDDPAGLGGVDSAPTPIETLMAALAGCVTSGIATNAAMFGVKRDGIDIEMDADIDVRGVFGHDKSVRNGIGDIRYTVTIHSQAPEDKVRKCKETIDRKSPIRDTIANPVNVTSTLVYKPR